MSDATVEKIYDELVAIRRELRAVKARLPSPDTVVTPVEERELVLARQEFLEGKGIPLATVERELGMRRSRGKARC